MKKYSDWQRYVREQIDRINDPDTENGQTTPQRPVPSIDKDKFTIHRKTPAAADERTSHAARSAPAAETEAKPFWNPAPHKAPDMPSADIKKQPPPTPAPSPFVSVHDVWKAAETTPQQAAKPAPPVAKQPAVNSAAPAQPAKKTTAEESSSPVAPQRSIVQRQTPRPASTPAPAAGVIDDSPQKGQKEESREEILERLINPTITLEETAKIMGVCKATVRRYTAMGLLPHYRTPGNQRRFKLNDIIIFLENQKRQ